MPGWAALLTGRFHLKIDAVRSAVELDEDGHGQRWLPTFEGLMQGGPEFEAQFGPDEVDDIARQRSADGLEVTPGVVREVQHSMHVIDDHAWRSGGLEGLPVEGHF